MNELSERLDADPPDDARALIIQTYTELLSDVPPEILSQFEAVLAELSRAPTNVVPVTAPPPPLTSPDVVAPPTSASSTTEVPATRVQATDLETDTLDEGDGSIEPTTTVSPEEAFDAEGRLPGQLPIERLNAYVQFSCRGVDNNPGPPPTPPLKDITTVDG